MSILYTVIMKDKKILLSEYTESVGNFP